MPIINDDTEVASRPSSNKPELVGPISRTGIPNAKLLATKLKLVSIRPTLLALVGSVLVTLLYGRVALVGLNRGVVGGDLDGYENLWNNYWVHTALFDLHRNPFFTNYIYYPTGISLRFHTLNPLNGLLFWPLWSIVGSVAATNLQFLLSMSLTSFCTYLLLKDLGASPLASFVGAVVFTFANDQLLGFYSFGQAEKLAQWWLPLYLWCLFRGLPGPLLRRWPFYLLASVGGLLAMSLTDWQLLMYGVLLTLGYGLYSLFGPHRWVILSRLTAVGLGWLAVVFFPLLRPMVEEAAQNPWLSVSEQSVWHSRTLSDFVESGTANPGYLVLLVSLSGFLLKLNRPFSWSWSWRRKATSVPSTPAPNLPTYRQLLFWGLVGLGAAILSLGPQLIVASSSNPTPTNISLPYALLYKLPVLSTGRDPQRFYLITMLSVGVFLGLALTEWFNRLNSWASRGYGNKKKKIRRRLNLTWLLACLVLIGTLSGFVIKAGDAKVDPPDWPPFYTTLAQDKEAYALLELPLFSEVGRGEDTYEAYQSIHGKYRFGGRLARDHKLTNPNNFTRQMTLFRDFYWLNRLGSPMEELRPLKNADILTAPDYGEWGIPLLNYYKVRYIVLYLDAFRQTGPKSLQRTKAMVQRVLGSNIQPIYQDENLLAYPVPTPTTSSLLPPTLEFVDIGSVGWYAPEKDPTGHYFRWARLENNETPSLVLFNAGTVNQPTKLDFKAFSFKQDVTLKISLDEQPLTTTTTTYTLTPGNSQAFSLNLSLPPGQHFLKLTPAQPPLSVGIPADDRKLSFALSDLKLVLSR